MQIDGEASETPEIPETPDNRQHVTESFRCLKAGEDNHSGAGEPIHSEKTQCILKTEVYDKEPPAIDGYVYIGCRLENEAGEAIDGQGGTIVAGAVNTITYENGKKPTNVVVPAGGRPERFTVVYLYREAARPAVAEWLGIQQAGGETALGTETVSGYIGEEVRVHHLKHDPGERWALNGAYILKDGEWLPQADKQELIFILGGEDMYGRFRYTAVNTQPGKPGGGAAGGGGGGTSGASGVAPPKPRPTNEGKDDKATDKNTVADRDTHTNEQAHTDEHIRYVYGYEDGTVLPDNPLTRAETAVMLYRLDGGGDIPPESSFSDMPDDAWYAQSVAWLENCGALADYPDGSFRPGNFITRAELSALLSRLGGREARDGGSFNDMPDEYWAERYIRYVSAKGWVAGYPDGSFRPDSYITRAEAISIINNMRNRKIRKEDIPSGVLRYTDLAYSHWSYSAVMEASVRHSCKRNEDGYEIWTEWF